MSGSCDLSNKGSTPLCDRCAKIDIDELLHGNSYQVSSTASKKAVSLSQQPHLSLGPAGAESFVSWCGLCQFFVAISPAPGLGPRVPNQTFVIRDAAEENYGQFYSDGMLVPYSPGHLFVARESVTPSGKLYSLGNAFCSVRSHDPSESTADALANGRFIKPHNLDYSVIRNWIGDCKETHTVCLVPPFKPLKVIDCKGRVVTRTAQDTTYVALSYVWGSSATSEEPSVNGQLSIKLPATVEDAISVTLQLGYSYLWVDRYCINQHGGEEKAQEIARMDEIYQGAEIVIIDSSGDDPSLGLPGVSRPRSAVQPHVTTTTQTLVSLLSYPRNQVVASKWATRGWTYQEGVLAKRRLFFTNQQVYFECGVYGCMETLCQPIVHPPCGVPTIRITDAIPDIKSVGTMIIDDYLREYSKRQLSYSSDILNAFRGIFHMSEKQSPPILHCGGVPLLLNDLDHQATPSNANLLGFLRGLLWIAPWEDAVRRPGFPSWSWTGWHCSGGGVKLDQPNCPIYCSLSQLYAHCDDTTTGFPIKYTCQTKLTQQDGPENLNLCIPSSPGALYMTGNIVTFRYISHTQLREELCLGSNTRGVYFKHINKPSRAIGMCAKPAITHIYDAGIPRGPQTLSAIEMARTVDPVLNRNKGLSSWKIDEESHQSEPSRSQSSILVIFMLLREILDTYHAMPYKVFERVGILKLDFPTVEDFQSSDWFLEAVEQSIVII
ncbi:HET-domain-containing protein [Xylaria venustula]|nr:HET-domain-containing protein [Xylaria venustula]